MAAPLRTPRNSWIEEGLRALGIGGPDAVRIEALAEALGVTKGGFYWHFDDRRALLEEMLDTWERVVIDEAIERVEEGGGDARAKLERLLSMASSKQARALGSIDLAIREWARRDQAVRRRLRRVDNRRNGIHALAVRRFLPGRKRGRGALPARPLAPGSQPPDLCQPRRPQPSRR